MERVNKTKILTPVLHSMAEGYKKQLGKYKVMLKLAEKQKEYAEIEDMVKLEEVILARQELIKELDEMNNRLKPLRNDIMNTLGLSEFSSTAILQAMPTKAAHELADTLGKLGEVLYSLKEMDHINEELLRKKLSQVNTDLNNIQNKNLAKKAYKKKAPSKSPKWVDESK